MSRHGRGARIAIVLGVLVLALVLGSAYPLLTRGQDLLAAKWQARWWLLALALVPLVLWRGTWGSDLRSAHLRVGSLAPLKSGPLGLRARLRDMPGVLRAVALTFAILALARPVSTVTPTETSDEGIDLVVALDLSGSMEAVMENLPPELEKFTAERDRRVLPMRVEAAKAVLRDFISRRKTDRIGVVVFAKDAYVLSPPTLDYQLLDNLVSRMQLETIDPHGTAIGDGIGVAVARLRRSQAKSKALLLVTDGDNQGGRLSPEYAAHLASKIGARIYSVQIGSGDASKIFRGFDLLGQARYEAKAYPTNPALLKKLADTTGGAMFIASDARELQASFHDALDRMEKTAFEAAQATYEELFRYLLLPGVVLIALEALLSAFVLRRFP
jgi:Ca-activated chloride channel family protein